MLVDDMLASHIMGCVMLSYMFNAEVSSECPRLGTLNASGVPGAALKARPFSGGTPQPLSALWEEGDNGTGTGLRSAGERPVIAFASSVASAGSSAQNTPTTFGFLPWRRSGDGDKPSLSTRSCAPGQESLLWSNLVLCVKRLI